MTNIGILVPNVSSDHVKSAHDEDVVLFILYDCKNAYFIDQSCFFKYFAKGI